MNPTELRALAEALDNECVLRLLAGGKNHEEAQACEQAADYLRQCAEQKPVAIVGEQHNSLWTGALVRSRFIWSPPSGDLTKMIFPLEDLPVRTKLYAAPVPPADRCRSSETLDPKATGPASPERPVLNREDAADRVAAGSDEQREPCIGNDPACPCQDGDACHYRDTATTKAWPIPQAEPKREPLSEKQIDAIHELWYERAGMSFADVVRAVERAHGITGDSDAD